MLPTYRDGTPMFNVDKNGNVVLPTDQFGNAINVVDENGEPYDITMPQDIGQRKLDENTPTVSVDKEGNLSLIHISEPTRPY